MQKKRMYIIGSWTRDHFMGVKPRDTDYLAIGYTEKDLLDQGFTKVSKSFPVYQHPITKDEYALGRTEKSTGDGHTDFTCLTENVTLEQDQMRRDFTINSIAYDVLTEEFIDTYNGQKDISKRIFRHISEAFSDDPVRVLRLAKFRARFGENFWTIAPETKVLIYSMRESLKTLTKERVWKEVWQAMQYKHTRIFFETLFELGVLDCIFPNIYQLTTLKEGNKWHTESSVFEHTMNAISLCTTPEVKIAALYHDIAKPYTYRTYGNGNGHDNIVNVMPLIELDIPAYIRKMLSVVIGNHLLICRYDTLTIGSKLDFLEKYKGKEHLFEYSRELAYADTNGATTTEVVDKTNAEYNSMFNIIAYSLDRLQDYKPEFVYKAINDDTSLPHKYIQERIRQEKCEILRSIDNDITLNTANKTKI